MRDARRAGSSEVATATAYTATKITASVSHGTSNRIPAQLACRAASLITLNETASPSSVPSAIDVRARNDASSTKLACTMLRWKPIAREDADVLASLDDCSRADHTERGDADHQPETEESEDDVLVRLRHADHVCEECVDGLGLEPMVEERRLEPPRRLRRVHTGSDLEVVDRRPHAVAEPRQRGLRREDAPHRVARGVLEHTDHPEVASRAGLGIAHGHADRIEVGILGVEAGELEVGEHCEVPVVPVRHDERVDDGEARLGRTARHTACAFL